MLYDLNIVWTPQTAQSDLERTLRFSQSLGYNVVALNHTFQAPIPAQVVNPIPQIGPVHNSFPQPHQTAATTTTNKLSSSLPTTLRRATILISDPASNHRLPTLAAAYDVLAARPTTDKAFAAACTSMSEIALISLDLSVSHPFRFKPKPCMAAVHRGVLFEICYGQLVAGTATDARARAIFIANVLELVRATKGRGIVLSSEASAGARGVGLRAPADVVNLLACWGLGSDKGMQAVGPNPRAVVVNEGLRRRGFRGVVDIVQAEGRMAIPASDEKGDGDGDGGRVAWKQPQQKPKNVKSAEKPSAGQLQSANGSGSGKRKHDGASDHGGRRDQTLLPAVSKRQAKKLKLAAEQKTTG